MRSPVLPPRAQPYSALLRLSRACRSLALPAVCALAVPLTSCDDLSRFSTGDNESYCGAITLGAAFRRGFLPGTQMRLTLDAARLDGGESPGRLWTQELRDPSETGYFHLLSDAPLRPIPPVAHDVLSRPDLGDGRVRTVVYNVTPTDPDAESLVAFVSLRSDGDIEVRLLRPGASDDAASVPAGRRPLFGLFTLHRVPGACF